ncbi:hypothetical protein BU16DRAFT_612669 [Lophium mytilinum]|uniref:Ras-domain-containing protein n=1 Tax=Lophium mytilinum TaxID=390894 RepID=A0A6A6REB9_9PEZI|nr:hypothetical protein BU16DRAFT_612669 [Lophium mytilinum]
MLYLIVGTKADIPVEEREVSVDEGREIARSIGATYGECSAKEAIGVDELMDDVAKVVLAERERVRVLAEKESLRVLALKEKHEDLTRVSGKPGKKFRQKLQGWLRLGSARRKGVSCE